MGSQPGYSLSERAQTQETARRGGREGGRGFHSQRGLGGKDGTGHKLGMLQVKGSLVGPPLFPAEQLKPREVQGVLPGPGMTLGSPRTLTWL